MEEPGKLILVVGTSSSGKTRSCTLLQRKFDDHYLRLSTDFFFQMVNPDWGGGRNGPLSSQGFNYQRNGDVLEIAYGETGLKILSGIIKSVEAMLLTGNNVIFDEMLLSKEHWNLWSPTILSNDTFVVHLWANNTTLSEREVSRGRSSKLYGLALGHVASNDIDLADLAIDTTNKSPEEVASEIESYLGKE